jgi:predicted ATPase
MKIEKICLKNFKVFQDIEIKNIPDFCVVVGANGVGKSTLFDVFGLWMKGIKWDIFGNMVFLGMWNCLTGQVMILCVLLRKIAKP